jgi:hypothetical protein
MAKIQITLTEEQERKNAEILARLEMERRRLVEDTRAIQEHERLARKMARTTKGDYHLPMDNCQFPMTNYE